MPRATPRPPGRFLILETGQPLARLRRYGGFADWIRDAAGLHRDAVTACAVDRATALPPCSTDFAGVLISGSPAMVTDRLDWSEACAAWLRDAAAAGTPLFGICYGHQLLAHALGGRVGDNPKGREIGTVTIECRADAVSDPLFCKLPAQFLAQVSHSQTVLQMPPKAVRLANSAGDDCQAFRYAAHVWGVQFHPDFSASVSRGYVHGRADQLRAEGLDPAVLLAGIKAAPHPRRLLRRFIQFAQQAGNA